jgi:hypothetical protein
MKTSLLTILLFFLSFSPNGGKEQNKILKSINITYIKGFIESPTLFDSARISKLKILTKDTIIIDEKVLREINYLLSTLKEQKKGNPSCDIRIICKANYSNNEILNFTIGFPNCIIIKNNEMKFNDSLIYLIRKESGYYNYFPKEEFLYFKELKKFGVPKNYEDLSAHRVNLPEIEIK